MRESEVSSKNSSSSEGARSTAVYGDGDSLPCSEETAAGPYPEAGEFGSQPRTLFL
jgi:hypothetical protein